MYYVLAMWALNKVPLVYHILRCPEIISLCLERYFPDGKYHGFEFFDIPDGKYLKFKYLWYLSLWIDKGAKGDTWPMSLTPTNGEFR